MTDNVRESEDEDSTLNFEGLAGEDNPVVLVREIEKVLAEVESGESGKDENSFDMGLPEAISLLPKQYVRENSDESLEGDTISISVKDLFKQLSSGKAEVSASELAFHIPMHLIYRAALDDQQVLKLPLQAVVKSLGLGAFKKRTPQTLRFYDTAELEDPFKQGEAAPEQSAGIVFEDEEPVAPAPAVAAPEPAKEVPPPALQAPEPSKPPETLAAAAAATEVEDVKDETVIHVQSGNASTVPGVQPAISVETPVPVAPERKDEPAVSTSPANSFDYPLAELLKLMPASMLLADAVARAGDTTVRIELSDLFDQLRRSKVTVSVAQVYAAIPAGVVGDGARDEGSVTLTLSLQAVVHAVGLSALRQLVPATLRYYDIERMVDPFKEPAVLPKLNRGVERGQHKEPVERVAAGSEPAVSEPKAVEYKGSTEGDLELSFHELPGNVNINATTAEDLMLFPDVSETLAAAIMDYGAKNDGFNSIFELMKVPGMDENIFLKMTGMKAGPRHYHRRNRLASLLKIAPERVANLKLVASTIASRSGFSGCIISDSDGLVLARSGVGPIGESLGAVLPKILASIQRNMDLIEADSVGSISMSINKRFYTISAGGNVVLTAVHSGSLVSEIELSFIRKVRVDLAWLLSFRAFAGPRI